MSRSWVVNSSLQLGCRARVPAAQSGWWVTTTWEMYLEFYVPQSIPFEP